MTVDERKLINAAWITAGHANGLYVIAHVGTTILSDAQALAAHAAAFGADAIASVPPYYERVRSSRTPYAENPNVCCPAAPCWL